jgi:hypothetical protein
VVQTKRWFACGTSWVLALAQFIAVSSSAEQIALGASADATLFGVNPLNSAGGDTFFLAGTTQNHTTNRALLLFDIAGAIPAGAQINSASLNVDVTRRPGCGFESSFFGLHRMLRSWGEGNTVVTDNNGGLGAPAEPGDATWDYRHAFSDPWATPGGAAGIDYVTDFSSLAFVFDVDLYQFEGTPETRADVQFWLDHPESNFGWMLKGESEELAFTARRFASSEDFSGGPQLIIDYTPVPEPGTLALGAIAALLLCFHRKLRKNLRQQN